MDGLLALDLWDIVIEVLRSTNNKDQPKQATKKLGQFLFQNQDPTCQKETEGWAIEWGGLRTHQHTHSS